MPRQHRPAHSAPTGAPSSTRMPSRARRPRRVPGTPVRRGAVAVLTALSLVLPTAAWAAPTSAGAVVQDVTAAATGLTLYRGTDDTLLLGREGTVRLAAHNHSGVPLYNVTFRDVLPTGLVYVPGSVSPAGLGEPTVVGPDADGATTLLWINATDVAVGETVELAYRVAVAEDATSPDGFALPVGTVVEGTAQVAASEDPRAVPDVDDQGRIVTGPDADASHVSDPSVTDTVLTAIDVTKTEPSPEHELLRGVHDHSTVYTLTSSPTVAWTAPGHLEFEDARPSLRRHLHDLIEEYGRHTGHMDLLREAIDGRVGEDPQPDWPMLPPEPAQD